MSFFHFSQNNSGGGFDFDEDRGLTHHVVIEAASAEAANRLAQDIGIYFDGCDTDRDCPCCGDRWNSACDSYATEEPRVYSELAHKATGFRWMDEGKEICVHYSDGRKLWYGVHKRAL